MLQMEWAIYPFVASSVFPSCKDALRTNCPQRDNSSAGVLRCDACAGRHQLQLRQAGCTAEDVQQWCAVVADAFAENQEQSTDPACTDYFCFVNAQVRCCAPTSRSIVFLRATHCSRPHDPAAQQQTKHT